MSYRYGDIRAPRVLFEEPLNVQDREFVACVQAGTQPRTNVDNGMAVVRVLEAANLSLETGAPVELGETPRLGAVDRQPRIMSASGQQPAAKSPAVVPLTDLGAMTVEVWEALGWLEAGHGDLRVHRRQPRSGIRRGVGTVLWYQFRSRGGQRD